MTTSPVPAPQNSVEPWLRGTRSETPAVARAVLHALDLALEDISRWTEGLTDAQMHERPHGLASLAFHLRHMARSIDRILTYAEGSQLSAEQLAALKSEQEGVESHGQLLAGLRASIANAEGRIQALAAQGPATLEAPRAVGRKQLPITAGGALVHVANHTQRHVGQVVTTARLLGG